MNSKHLLEEVLSKLLKLIQTKNLLASFFKLCFRFKLLFAYYSLSFAIWHMIRNKITSKLAKKARYSLKLC